MNLLTIAGNLGREARINQVQGQNGPISVANFAVAVKKRQKGSDGKPLTLWVDCALWGTRADALAQYLTKGTRVAVSGEADVEQYQAQDGTMVPKLTLRVNELTLLGGGEQAQQQGGQGQPYQQPMQRQQQPAGQPGGYQAPAPQPQGQQGGFDDFDDDIPF